MYWKNASKQQDKEKDYHIIPAYYLHLVPYLSGWKEAGMISIQIR